MARSAHTLPGTSHTLGPLCVRVAIGAALLSAVADRFGVWGRPGMDGVSWGTFADFIAYMRTLNPFLPETAIVPLAWVVTVIEVALAAALMFGLKTRLAATASAAFLIAFAGTITAQLGPKGPLDQGLWLAAAAALLLAGMGPDRLTLDRLLARRAARDVLRG